MKVIYDMRKACIFIARSLSLSLFQLRLDSILLLFGLVM
jgi:hypothetical protein